jgi:hypothetical protein
MRSHSIRLASLLLLFAVGGCSVTVQPNQPAASCSANSNLVCTAGTSGYSCTGDGNPEQFTADLVCSPDTTGAGDFCCATSTCMFDPGVGGCVSGTDPYSCAAGAQRPDQADTSKVCSEPNTATPGVDLYCCYTPVVIVTTSTPTCSEDQSVAGCAAGSFGYSCTGTDTPEMDFANLPCSTGTADPSGAMLFCCTY